MQIWALSYTGRKAVQRKYFRLTPWSFSCPVPTNIPSTMAVLEYTVNLFEMCAWCLPSDSMIPKEMLSVGLGL